MGRLAERHAQHARTSGGNNFRVRLLEELHCHTPTHEQLLHEGRAGIALGPPLLTISSSTAAVTGIISGVTSAPGTTVNFAIAHTFLARCLRARALLNGPLKTFPRDLQRGNSCRLLPSFRCFHRRHRTTFDDDDDDGDGTSMPSFRSVARLN